MKTESFLFFFFLQAQNLDLCNATPVKIFELMFQSPENSVSQDEANPSGGCFPKLVASHHHCHWFLVLVVLSASSQRALLNPSASRPPPSLSWPMPQPSSPSPSTLPPHPPAVVQLPSLRLHLRQLKVLPLLLPSPPRPSLAVRSSSLPSCISQGLSRPLTCLSSLLAKHRDRSPLITMWRCRLHSNRRIAPPLCSQPFLTLLLLLQLLLQLPPCLLPPPQKRAAWWLNNPPPARVPHCKPLPPPSLLHPPRAYCNPV